MQFKQLLEDDDAVSPVIGVILMVAITVILAAVIGTFVLGLGDQVQETAPTAQFSFDHDASASELEITHDGGDGIDADALTVSHEGTVYGLSSATGSTDTTVSGTNWFASSGSTVTAGSSVTLNNDFGNAVSDGDDVRVLWNAEGDRSSTLAQWDN